MISIENLYFKYNKTENYVLENITANFESGTVNVLLGLNGSGKTTLFDILSGILSDKVSKGIVQSEDFKDTMYMTQGILFPSVLKGKDLIRLYLKGDYKNSKNSYEEYVTLLKGIHKNKIEYLSNKSYKDMSVGERRWLTFTLAMMLKRKVYLFDEPTTGIDPHSKADVLDGINELSNNKDKVIIMSTHVLHDLKDINCKIHLLHNGKMQFIGTYDEFIKKYNNENPDKAFRNFINNIKGNEN